MKVSFKPTFHRHRKRSNNTYSVVIKVGIKSRYAFIDTDLSISDKDINKKGEIKNTFILGKCYDYIEGYKSSLLNAGDLSDYNVQMVKEYLLEYKDVEKGLDYVELFNEYLNINKNSPSYDIYKATFNHLNRFCKNGIMVDDITPRFLTEFENYLKSRMGSRGVELYLGRIRAVYNWIVDEWSYKGFVFNTPFRKFKIKKSTPPKTTALTKEQLRAIIEIEPVGLRANRARDLFVISLLACGTNAIDIYKLESIGVRLEYNRSKTRDRRDDEAFISIKIEPELKVYLEKYSDGVGGLLFSQWYANPPKLNEAIWKGLKSLREQINKKHGVNFIVKLEYYDARRSLASIMRNKLGISTEDVRNVLNHESKFKTTDIYIEVDFTRNDECNKMFIDWLYG